MELLDEALEASILEEDSGGGDRYQFSHALVQQTFSDELSTSRRVRLHARIGEALEKLYGADAEAHAAKLAHRYSEAEPVATPEKLVRYCILAGDQALASYSLEDALAFCRKAGYRPELAWTCHDYAVTLSRRNASGDREKILFLLDEALSIVQELGMRPFLERVITLQDKVEVGRARTAYPNGLTEREIDVLRLIAACKGNHEIAEELFISQNAVIRHVINIFSKIE